MPQSTNFFAALDDSDDDSAGGRQTTKTNTSTARSTNNAGSNSGITTSAKNDRRKNERNSTKGGRGEGGRVRPAARDGKRTFDRRSGTGRGREIKKDGGGARNWGSDKADARKAEGTVDENEVVAVDAEDGAGGEGGAAAGEGGGDDVKEEEVVEPEPEPVTRTYDEYLEDRKNELKDKPQFQPTAKKELVNEFAGVAAKTVVKDEEFLKMGSGKSLRVKPKKGQEKQVVELGFRTGSKPGGGDSRYGDRDRGDRGDRDRGGRGNDRRRDGEGRGRGRGGRGGRGRGRRSGRGGREGGRAPAVDPLDPSAFPSL